MMVSPEAGNLGLLRGAVDAVRSPGTVPCPQKRRTKSVRRYRWILKLINATGRQFMGDKTGALADLRAGLDLAPRSLDASNWVLAGWVAAQTYAWAGAEDEAVQLLEERAASVSGLMPADITRNPTLSIPLANNSRYKALSARLEAQMRSLKLD
jgi:hypothetical protein